MAVTRLHILNMLALAALGVFILALSLVTANKFKISGAMGPEENWKLYFGREVLPDHIFYPLLMIADRIRLDQAQPIDQVFIQLEYSEKRYKTTEALLDRNQEIMAISTLTKSQKYLISAGQQILEIDSATPQQLQEVRAAVDHSLYRLDTFTSQYGSYDLGAVTQLREETRILLLKIDEKIVSIQ